MPSPAVATFEARSIDARELAERARIDSVSVSPLSPERLEWWLIRQGFAVRVPGGLAPTSRCVDIVTAIDR